MHPLSMSCVPTKTPCRLIVMVFLRVEDDEVGLSWRRKKKNKSRDIAIRWSHYTNPAMAFFSCLYHVGFAARGVGVQHCTQ